MNNVYDIQTQAQRASRSDLASLGDAGSAPEVNPVLPARDPEALQAPKTQHPPVARGMYSQTFWEHARNPRNRHALSDATNVGESGFPRCGDRITLYLNVTDGRITEASFEARACAPVIAVASLGTQEITGLSIDDARELSILELDRRLGGLPPSKRHAYLVFLESLQNAITQITNPNKGESQSCLL